MTESRTTTATAAAAPTGTPGRWRDVVVLWAVSRVLYEGVALVAVGVAGPARDREPGFFGLLHHWDSNWFDAIMRAGYFGPSYVDVTTPGARTAFFPGYPLTARAVGWVAGGGELTTGSGRFALWLVPFLASFVAAGFMYRTVAPRFGVAAARWATGLLLLGPYGVFLAASYSEALFLAFAVGAWWALVRRQPLLAGVLAAGASWTRVNGGFLAVGLVVLHVQQQRQAGLPVRARDLAALLLAFAGAAGYLVWLWGVSGTPTTWLKAQSDRFGHEAVLPWVSLWHAVKLVVVDQSPDQRLQHVFELVAAGVLLLAVIAFLRAREWAAVTFVVLSTFSLVTNVSYLSLARNVLTMFPVFVLAGVWVVRSPRRRLVHTAVALAGLVALVNAVSFSLGFWTD